LIKGCKQEYNSIIQNFGKMVTEKHIVDESKYVYDYKKLAKCPIIGPPGAADGFYDPASRLFVT
jgi:hypothetical protein